MSITLSRSSVTSKPDFVLFLDPSINFTGYAVYRLERINFAVQTRLTQYGVVESPQVGSATERTYSMVRRCLEHSCTAAVIELPPDTIYGYKQLSKDMLVTKAESVFKTYGVAMSLLCGLRALGRQAATIYPRQWELDHRPRKKLGYADVKEWSMAIANRALERDGFLNQPLHTRKEQNAADAVTMGERLLPALLDGKLPTTT